MSTYDERIGSVLRRYRRANEVTQQQVADALGIHVNTYLPKEKGRVPFTVRELRVAAEAIGVPATAVLTEAEVASESVRLPARSPRR